MATVIRLTTAAGETRVIGLNADDWILSPDDDLAVTRLPINALGMPLESIPLGQFVDRGAVRDLDVGPGDDIFIVGRFGGHPGKSVNLPSVRFGTISMMPIERIRHPTIESIEQESYLADLYTIRGYSGSPVFLWRGINTGEEQIRLLGMYWMTFEDRQRLVTRDRDRFAKLQYEDPITFENAVSVLKIFTSEGNAGLSAVLPAWRISAVLNVDPIQGLRSKEEGRRRDDPRRTVGYLGVPVDDSDGDGDALNWVR